MQLTFTGRVIEWRGPAPFSYLPVTVGTAPTSP
jgi:hypothetical protein